MSEPQAAEHSSDMVGALLPLTAGLGGGKLLVVGEFRRDLRYWAGLRQPPVATLFEAVLRCLLAGGYQRIIAFTGSASGGLPPWQLGNQLALGDEALVWVVRGEGKPAPVRQAVGRKPFEVSLEDLGPTTEALGRVIWRSATRTYWERLQEFVRLRNGEIDRAHARGERCALVVDVGFLVPTPSEAAQIHRDGGVAVGNPTARGIERGFVLPQLGPVDVVLIAEDGAATELLDEGGKLLPTVLPILLGPDWRQIATMVERTVPRLYLGPGFERVSAQRTATPFQNRGLELAGADGSVYELVRRARIGSRASTPMPPRRPERIDLEFWSGLDLEPLRRAFDDRIIGQHAVKKGVLAAFGEYRNRCQELLRDNPQAVKTAADDLYRLPVFGLFGAAGMGKTFFCQILASHLFGDEGFACLIDLSGKLLGTETVGVAPPYVGWDHESTLIRFARQNRGLGLVGFDEFVRIQLLRDEALADALSPLFEMLQARSFVPASPLFVPAGRHFHMANTVFVFAGNVSPPGQPPPMGFRSVEELGSPFSRRLTQSGNLFYFEPLGGDDFEAAVRIALRRVAREWALDFAREQVALVDAATLDSDLVRELRRRVLEAVRMGGGQPSHAHVTGVVAQLPYRLSFDAMAARGGEALVFGTELLQERAG